MSYPRILHLCKMADRNLTKGVFSLPRWYRRSMLSKHGARGAKRSLRQAARVHGERQISVRKSARMAAHESLQQDLANALVAQIKAEAS